MYIYIYISTIFGSVLIVPSFPVVAPLQTTRLGSARFGSAVTVVEMDGEIDMENMEDQLKDGLR